MNYASHDATQKDIDRRFRLAMAQPEAYRLRLKSEAPKAEDKRAAALAECRRIMGGR